MVVKTVLRLGGMDNGRTNQEPLFGRGQALIKPCVDALQAGSEWRAGISDEGQSEDGRYRWSQAGRSEI